MENRLRVAMVGQSTFPYTNRLMRYLSNRPDVDLHLITFGNGSQEVKQNHISVHTISLKRPLSFSIFLSPGSIARELLKIKPDIVHIVQQLSYSLIASLLKDKYPTLLTVVGLIARESKFYADLSSIGGICSYVYTNLIAKGIERYVLSKIANIIVESSHNQNIISKMTNSKIYVVPDGIEFNLIEKIQPDPSKKIDAFSVGELHHGKGVDLLIRAVPMIAKLVPVFCLAIAGKGRQENELRELTRRLNLENHVKFLGYISDEEKFQYYKACKFAVVPSRWDFSPITIYEAMACGKPVIASTQTNSEILVNGETGLLFESENVEDLVEKMLTLFQNDEFRERMAQNAIEKAKEYDWSKIAARTVEVYRQVITDFREQKPSKHKR
jgi:glycosyltransferase involved in cell wall biosynthesis